MRGGRRCIAIPLRSPCHPDPDAERSEVKRFLCIFALTLGAIPAALSQQSPADKPPSPARAEVLVLGVYHMSNPGHDIFNMQADDVLAPRRQGEIAQLTAALQKFHPTKIAVEADVGNDRIPKRYADYLAGKYELTRNEIDQIGLRLAKELGYKTVYAVDVDGEFPFKHVDNYAKASGRSKELDAMMAEIEGMVKAQNAYLASHTVLETLLYMNADDKVAPGRGLLLRCRTPRLAATRLRQQPQPPLAQARGVRQVNQVGRRADEG